MLVTMQVVVHISIAFVLAVVDVDEASNLAISFGRTDGWYQAFDTITLLILLPLTDDLSSYSRGILPSRILGPSSRAWALS